MPVGNHSGIGFWGQRYSFGGEDYSWKGHLAILPQTGIFDIYNRGWKERVAREGTTDGVSGDWLCKGPGTGGDGPKDVSPTGLRGFAVASCGLWGVGGRLAEVSWSSPLSAGLLAPWLESGRNPGRRQPVKIPAHRLPLAREHAGATALTALDLRSRLRSWLCAVVRIRIAINGVETSDWTDPDPSQIHTGPIALQQVGFAP